MSKKILDLQLSKITKIRLGVNIDHVATIRNARGGEHPSPVKAAILAQKYDADGITIHLREDRRHIRDEDLKAISSAIDIPLNLEMAATNEMLEIALKAKPNAACIVPEKRQEVTTEGGLDVIGGEKVLKPIIAKLKKAGIRVSLFVDPDEAQIKCCAKLGADIVEIHTGKFCHLFSSRRNDSPSHALARVPGKNHEDVSSRRNDSPSHALARVPGKNHEDVSSQRNDSPSHALARVPGKNHEDVSSQRNDSPSYPLDDSQRKISEKILQGALSAAPNIHEDGEIELNKEAEKEFSKISDCAKLAEELGIECHAGHGLNYETAKIIAKIPQIIELNIGHFLIGEAIFDGFENVIEKMKVVIER